MKRNALIMMLALLPFCKGKALETVTITWSGNTATVNIPATVAGVRSSVNGGNVTITSTTTTTEYAYQLSGKCANGSLSINGSYKYTLQLNGLDLARTSSGAVINDDSGKRIAVEILNGTTNAICDAAGGSQKGAMYFKGHPEFTGNGILNVTGKTKHAIAAKEYIEMKDSTYTINILGAVSDGIHCGKAKAGDTNNYFKMKGGTLNISNVGSDGVDADDYGCVKIQGGKATISVADGGSGLKADSILTISGGTLDISVPGADADALRARYRLNISGGESTINVTGNGSKGIKGKRVEKGTADGTVFNGGYVNISGGTTNITVSGGTFYDTTVTPTDTVKCMGASIDADLVQTAGTVVINIQGSDTYGYNVKGTETRTGGTWTVNGTPANINAVSNNSQAAQYFGLDGRQLQAPQQKGITIMRKADGSTVKFKAE